MDSIQPTPPDRNGPPHNPGLKNLIAAKREWHYRPDEEARTRGFLGWHERGYLPHFDAPGVTQFVTFMLRAAFPVTRRHEWEPLTRELDRSLRQRKIETWLDRGHGACWLRNAEVAEVAEAALRVEDGSGYRLRAWVLMPNHVHLVVEVWQIPLSALLQLWKGRSARAANQVLRRSGALWEREYFDSLVRDDAHRRIAIRYTEHNPLKAGFVAEPTAWRWSSARWRDEQGRLPLEQKPHDAGNPAG